MLEGVQSSVVRGLADLRCWTHRPGAGSLSVLPQSTSRDKKLEGVNPVSRGANIASVLTHRSQAGLRFSLPGFPSRDKKLEVSDRKQGPVQLLLACWRFGTSWGLIYPGLYHLPYIRQGLRLPAPTLFNNTRKERMMGPYKEKREMADWVMRTVLVTLAVNIVILAGVIVARFVWGGPQGFYTLWSGTSLGAAVMGAMVIGAIRKEMH